MSIAETNYNGELVRKKVSGFSIGGVPMKGPKNKSVARIMLNLLETLTGKKRQTIKNWFSKNKKKVYLYGDVIDYIKNTCNLQKKD